MEPQNSLSQQPVQPPVSAVPPTPVTPKVTPNPIAQPTVMTAPKHSSRPLILTLIAVIILCGGIGFVYMNYGANGSLTTQSGISSDQNNPTSFGVSSAEPNQPFSLRSQFFKDNATAQDIASGRSAGVNARDFSITYGSVGPIPSADNFAFRVINALRMLGYQDGVSVGGNYIADNYLTTFKRLNNLPPSGLIDLATLRKIDDQLVEREAKDAQLAKNFPLYPYLVTAPASEPSKEHAAALFQIAFSALPANLVVWNETNFKAYMRDQGGRQFSGSDANYKICLSVLYPEFGDSCSPTTFGMTTFWGSDLAIVGTQIHEYSHFIDANVYTKEVGTSRGTVSTTGFYAISFDTSKVQIGGSGWKNYPIRRPANAKNEFVSAYATGWAASSKDSDTYIRTAQEDFAESMAMYVVEGAVFRELGKTQPVLQQKYDWLKQNVFDGREYNTGEVRGIAFMKEHPTASLEDVPGNIGNVNGAYNILHFSTYLPDFVWNYELKS